MLVVRINVCYVQAGTNDRSARERGFMKRSVDYIILLLYSICLFFLWRLCKLGGVRSYLKILIPAALLLFVFLIVKAVLEFHGYRAKFLKARWAFLIVLTGIFAGLIIYTAIPYHGALSWAIDDLRHHKKVDLEHSNIYENGIDGILEDVNAKMTLPEDLYVSDDFFVEFTADGTITSIDSFLYGKDANGETKTFLLSYDGQQDGKMDVWIDGYANATFDEDKRLAPLSAILARSDFQTVVMAWDESNRSAGQTGQTSQTRLTDQSNQANGQGFQQSSQAGDFAYAILYYGKREFASDEGLVYLAGDADGDGISGSNILYKLMSGGAVSGYEMSLYQPANNTVTPIRYIMEPEYISPDMLRAEHEEEIVQEVQDAQGEVQNWMADREDGSVYTFVTDNKSIGYRLSVVDAAASSRAYELERSDDGGASWKTVNEDPFSGDWGVAEGIEFSSKDFGFTGLQNASGDWSQIYVTRDGGKDFTQIQLPMDEVSDVPEQGKSYGLTLEDYQYCLMPVQEDGKWTISVNTGDGETEGIVFESSDDGATWELRAQG